MRQWQMRTGLARGRRIARIFAAIGLAIGLIAPIRGEAAIDGRRPALAATPIDGQRIFPETGYAIAHPAIREYFDRRGGVTTFGYPVSNAFRLLGFTVQIFQRHVLQVGPDGAVRPLNLLDPDLLPVTTVNGATFPGHEVRIAQAAPAPGAPDYTGAVRENLDDQVPDEWEGLPVRFRVTYLAAGTGDVPLLGALDVWGFPTSWPARDPNNRDFVYQRFQRGILHYDARTNQTGGVLLADAFKSVLTGQDLPADLAAQMAASRFLGQFCPGNPAGLCRPRDLPDTDLTGAFAIGGRTVTMNDHGRTIELPVGESFRLTLGNSYTWDVQIEDPAIVGPKIDAVVPPTAVGVFEARRPGRTRLVAIGLLPCHQAQPPCRAPSPVFEILILVR